MTVRPLVVPQQVSDRNRSRIVLTLGQQGPQSRADLARLSGVTRTTIGSYVDRLIDEGLLEEVDDPRPDQGPGRPSRPVWFRRDAARCGAVILGKGKVEVALVNARGELLNLSSASISKRVTALEATEVIADLLQSIDAHDPEVLGLGLALPGMVKDQRQVISPLARFSNLDGTELACELEEATGLRVVVDNDSRAGALAELWWGLGRRYGSFWAVQVGEGIGGGEVSGGEISRGMRGAAGEVGHITVDTFGERCACGFNGCWETVASMAWLRRTAAHRGIRGGSRMTVERLMVLGESDDVAAELLNELVENLAVGITNLIRVRDPGLVVLQGPITLGGPALEHRISSAVQRRSLLNTDDPVEVRFSQMGERARLFGAGALVLSATWSVKS